MNVDFAFNLALPQLNGTHDKEQMLILVRQDSVVRRDHRISLTQLAQFNQSAMLQLFSIPPLALQNNGIINLDSSELVHHLSILCLKVPIAWYNLATFIIRTGLDLLTLAALDYSTLLSEGLAINALLELFHSTRVLAISGKSYYYAEHLLSLGHYSIFGSGNMILLLRNEHETSLNMFAMCSQFRQKARLLAASMPRRRIVKLPIPPIYFEATLQHDLQTNEGEQHVCYTSQWHEFGLITRVAPSYISITTTSHVYATVSWHLFGSGHCLHAGTANLTSFLLQGVMLVVECDITPETFAVRRTIKSICLYPSTLSEFAEVLFIERCVPTNESSFHMQHSTESASFMVEPPAFTDSASCSSKFNLTETSRLLKDIFWATTVLSATVAGHNFMILAISRLSRLLYEVLMQIGRPFYCLWTVSNLAFMSVQVLCDPFTPPLSRNIITSSLLRSGLLIIDIQLPIRFYGRVYKRSPNLLFEPANAGREYQLFNLSAAQYKHVIWFINRTSTTIVTSNDRNFNCIWPDVSASVFSGTSLEVGNCSCKSSLGSSLALQRPSLGSYSRLTHIDEFPCRSCSSLEEHEALLDMSSITCSIYENGSNWEAVACAHVVHFDSPLVFELIWYNKAPLVFTANTQAFNDDAGSSLYNKTVRDRVLQAIMAYGCDGSCSNKPRIVLHTNTFLRAVLQHLHLVHDADPASSAGPANLPILEDGDSFSVNCEDAELFFDGDSIILTNITILSMHCKSHNILPVHLNSKLLWGNDRLPAKNTVTAIASAPDMLTHICEAPVNPFIVSSGINYNTPKYYKTQFSGTFNDSNYFEMILSKPKTFDLLHDSFPIQSSSPQIRRGTARTEPPTPTYSQHVDSAVAFPINNSNCNSLPIFPFIDPFISSSTVSTPRRSFFPILTSITDASDLSSDAFGHNSMTHHPTCDTTGTLYQEGRFSGPGSSHESIDILSTMDYLRYLLYNQDLNRMSNKCSRDVIGYVRYHFPSFGLAVISFEDQFRADGWVHSLAVWSVPAVLQRSRIVYPKKANDKQKQFKKSTGESDHTRPFFVRARVQCTVFPFNEASLVHTATNVRFLDYTTLKDELCWPTKDHGEKFKKKRKQSGDSSTSQRKTIHATVYWQENTKGSDTNTSFGFVRLCNGHERHFSISTPADYLGHLVTITLTSRNKNHESTCELHRSLLRPPIQQHWLLGRLALLLRGKECERIFFPALKLISSSFRSKVILPVLDFTDKLSQMILVMGFIITEGYQNTHVDCSFFRLVLPKSVADRLEVGMLLRYTLKEGAYHKVIDISDSLYSTPCELINHILSVDNFEASVFDASSTHSNDSLNSEAVYTVEQPAMDEMFEENSRRLSCWAVDNISLLDDMFKGSYKHIETRKCWGIKPEESFFARYSRYLLSSRATLIYLPRPALDVEPTLFQVEDAYTYAVHFVYNEQKQGVSAEANSITKDVISNKASRHVIGCIYPLTCSELGHNVIIHIFIPESMGCRDPSNDALSWLQKCVALRNDPGCKGPEHGHPCIVSQLAFFSLRGRLLAYAKQFMNTEDLSAVQEWIHSVMLNVTTGKMSVVASDFCLSLTFSREVFLSNDWRLESPKTTTTVMMATSSDSMGETDESARILTKPCFWCYIAQTISLRKVPTMLSNYPLKPLHVLDTEFKYPHASFEF